ncbi:hypothetical protein [Phreatobacter sp.]|uniref:hypothetical protein n=1 Tax=Phreatobacter sp. TaxID=1966341 RepID=UPI003F705E6A
MADYIDLHSPLIEHPEHLQAIGELSVEMSNLELAYSNLLSLLLDINPSVAEAIYFTPKASIPRLDVIANVAACLFPDDKHEHRVIIAKFVGRGRAAFGRRHDIIHHHWGVSSEDGFPVSVARPLKKPPEPVPLVQIRSHIDDCRRLMSDIFHYVATIQEHLQSKSSGEKSPEQQDPSRSLGCEENKA